MKDCHRLIEVRIENLIKKVRGNLEMLERMKIINIISINAKMKWRIRLVQPHR